MTPWQELSRKEWGNIGDMDGKYPGTAELALGLGQRIAAALERIADAVDPARVEAQRKQREKEEAAKRRQQLIDRYYDQWHRDWLTISQKVFEFLDNPECRARTRLHGRVVRYVTRAVVATHNFLKPWEYTETVAKKIDTANRRFARQFDPVTHDWSRILPYLAPVSYAALNAAMDSPRNRPC